MSLVSVGTRRECQKPGNAVTGSCELSSGVGGSGTKLRFSGKQCELLTTELSLQPLYILHCKTFFFVKDILGCLSKFVYIYLFIIYLNRTSCIPGWPQTQYLDKDDYEKLIFLSLPPEY